MKKKISKGPPPPKKKANKNPKQYKDPIQPLFPFCRPQY